MNILITGTSSGIGRYLARALGQKGHHIWGLARSPQGDFRQELSTKNILFRSCRCDVSSWDQVAKARAEVGNTWSSLEAMVCCSGVQPPVGPAMTLNPLAWSANIRTNLDGTYFAIRAFYDLLGRAARRAKVVCFSGGGATSPRPNFSAYASSKAGVVRLVETLAYEWTGQPIDINAVAPGAIYTKMTEEVLQLGSDAAGQKEFAQANKQKEQGSEPMERVGALIEFLLSADSDGISGRLISAPWDPWPELPKHKTELKDSDILTLRRIRLEDRGFQW